MSSNKVEIIGTSLGSVGAPDSVRVPSNNDEDLAGHKSQAFNVEDVPSVCNCSLIFNGS